MEQDFAKTLVDRYAIARRVEEVALQIARELDLNIKHDADPDHEWNRRQITLVPILTGSVVFLADLVRHLPVPMRMSMVWVSSYPGAATTSQGVILRGQADRFKDDLANAHVLIIDDILDSGGTLRFVTAEVAKHNPASVRSCVLLRKKREEAMAYPVDYVCFDIPDEFVVGYGLDYNGYFRNVPDIVTLTPQAIARAGATK
jgi:hypoxanthine phosphoribosyltransferase